MKGIEATIDELRSKFNKTFEEVKDGKGETSVSSFQMRIFLKFRLLDIT